MPWTRGLTDYLHVKEFLEESKSIYDEALKNSEFQGRLEYMNPVNSGSNGRSKGSGTRAIVKVGVTPIIISQIDEKKIEIEEQSGLTRHFVNLPTLTQVNTS